VLDSRSAVMCIRKNAYLVSCFRSSLRERPSFASHQFLLAVVCTRGASKGPTAINYVQQADILSLYPRVTRKIQ